MLNRREALGVAGGAIASIATPDTTPASVWFDQYKFTSFFLLDDGRIKVELQDNEDFTFHLVSLQKYSQQFLDKFDFSKLQEVYMFDRVIDGVKFEIAMIEWPPVYLEFPGSR